MTIYIVTSGEYSDYGIECVFSTREQAERYVALQNDNKAWWSECWFIEEYEVDGATIETDKPLWYHYEFSIVLRTIKDIQPTLKYEEPYDIHERRFHYWSKNGHLIDKDVNDAYMKWKAEKEEI